MDEKTNKSFEARAKIVKAMAHATRLFILNTLTKGERCVCELTGMIGADVSTVSKHLTILREAGLVSSDKRGNQVFYSLRCTCIGPFFDCIESVIRGNTRRHATLVKTCCRSRERIARDGSA